jgi:hypothetical protein
MVAQSNSLLVKKRGVSLPKIEVTDKSSKTMYLVMAKDSVSWANSEDG